METPKSSAARARAWLLRSKTCASGAGMTAKRGMPRSLAGRSVAGMLTPHGDGQRLRRRGSKGETDAHACNSIPEDHDLGCAAANWERQMLAQDRRKRLTEAMAQGGIEALV